MKLRDALTAWVNDRAPGWSYATTVTARHMARTFSRFYWKNAGFLDKHTSRAMLPENLKNLYTKLYEHGYAFGTINNRVDYLKMFIQWCVETEVLRAPEAARAASTAHVNCGTPVLTEARKPFTQAQYNQMLEHCSSSDGNLDHWIPIMMLGWETGMRSRDIRSLTPDNINLKEMEIRFVPAKSIRSKPKPVSIPISRELADVLREWVENGLSGEAIFDMWGEWDPTDTKFQSEFREKVMIPCSIRGMTFHCFRNGFITSMLKRGVSPHIICAMTGQHIMTMLKYGAVDTDQKKEALQIA